MIMVVTDLTNFNKGAILKLIKCANVMLPWKVVWLAFAHFQDLFELAFYATGIDGVILVIF